MPFVATAEGVVVADLGLEAGESVGLGCCCEVGGPPENVVKHWTRSVKSCSTVSSNNKQLSRPNGKKLLKILSCRMGYARVKQKMLPVSMWKCGFKLLSTYVLDRSISTTLQSMMNAKLSKYRFWHCYENGLIKTIQTIPHNL